MRPVLLATLFLLATGVSAQQATPAAQPNPEPRPTPAPVAKVRPQLNELTQFNRYSADNDKLGPPASGTQRVVFYGDSLTDNWGRKAGSFFPGKPYVNRGISGQTTPQMLLRFQQDVVSLHPAAVLILAGTNDVAENTGPYTDTQIQDNFKSMVQISLQNHIRVILASIPPADHFPWRKGIEPAARIRTLNAWMKAYADEQHLVYLDYYAAMTTPQGAMRPELALDQAVHPNDAGYAIMQPLAEAAIAKSLATPAP
jgi:lysophospholipase L1-like esterase